MINGIINIYKEKGYTSFACCAKLRRILSTPKIGHTGTLDPYAEGVLPICFGNATKLVEVLTEGSKEYETIFRLGITTDTQDMTGEVLCKREVKADSTVIADCIMSFQGEYEQIPPMYSAIKIHGRKLYDIAREGEEIDRDARKVVIHEITILAIDIEKMEVTMRVCCSKGTYIRTLCHDIGEKLGCGAAVKELKRTRTGMFHIQDSIRIAEAEDFFHAGRLDEILQPTDSFLLMYPKTSTLPEFNHLLINGNPLRYRETDYPIQEDKKDIKCIEYMRIYLSDGTFYALYQHMPEIKKFTPYKMFPPK